jgi:hypothetical protein
MPLGPLFSVSAQTLVASAACATLAWLVGSWNLSVGVAAGVLSYLPLLFLVGTLSRDDGRFVRQMLRPTHAG